METRVLLGEAAFSPLPAQFFEATARASVRGWCSEHLCGALSCPASVRRAVHLQWQIGWREHLHQLRSSLVSKAMLALLLFGTHSFFVLRHLESGATGVTASSVAAGLFGALTAWVAIYFWIGLFLRLANEPSRVLRYLTDAYAGLTSPSERLSGECTTALVTSCECGDSLRVAHRDSSSNSTRLRQQPTSPTRTSAVIEWLFARGTKCMHSERKCRRFVLAPNPLRCASSVRANRYSAT